MTNELMKETVLELAETLKEDGFPVGNILDVKMSWGKKTLGRCQRIGDKGFIIRISKYADIENTVFHELIHTFPGAFNHGNVFQQYANKINLIHYTEVGTHSPLPKIRTNVTLVCPCCRKTLHKYVDLNNYQILNLRKKLRKCLSKCCHKDIKLIFD